MYQEGQVVQAQVVQATVVGQPVGTVQHGVVQPQPYGMPSAYHGGLTTDQQGAQQGWMIYGIGWALMLACNKNTVLEVIFRWDFLQPEVLFRIGEISGAEGSSC
ncbi:unnamed protein product [Effrenium voratum]|nr:unnamed protein product [Effrenium voratum]